MADKVKIIQRRITVANPSEIEMIRDASTGAPSVQYVPPAVVEKRAALRSFADLRGVDIKTVQPPFTSWSAEGKALECVGQATQTLMQWLTARFQDLVREKVPLEAVSVTHSGGRCVVKVDNKVRFEFKLKCTMEGK